MSKKRRASNVLLENRRSRYDYFLSDFMTAGLVLTGTEIKSLRRGDASLSDSYVYIKNGEAYIANMHIAPFKEGNIFNVDHLRDRKLLLNKQEIRKLENKTKGQSLTIVPTKCLLQHGYAKLEIAIGRGKKLYDKRAAIKAKDQERERQRGGDD